MLRVDEPIDSDALLVVIQLLDWRSHQVRALYSGAIGDRDIWIEFLGDRIDAGGWNNVARENLAGPGGRIEGQRIVDRGFSGEVAAQQLLSRKQPALHAAQPLEEALVASECEELFLQNRRAQAAAELVALEGLRHGGEEVASVHFVISQEFVGAAMPFVRARLGGHVDNTRRVAELGLEEVALNFEFLYRIERRVHGRVAYARVAQLDAIEQVAGGTFPLAAHQNAAVGSLRGRADKPRFSVCGWNGRNERRP